MPNKTDEKVLRAVEELLLQDPSISMDALYEQISTAFPKVGELDRRQFNARYPLQIKRRLARESGATGAPRTRTRGGSPRKRQARLRSREQIREIVMGFAVSLAGAEGRSELVQAFTSVDEVVDRIVQAAGVR